MVTLFYKWFSCSSNARLQDALDMEVIKDILNDRDGQLIQQIPISLGSREDTWFWFLDDKGIFQLKVVTEGCRVKLIVQMRVFAAVMGVEIAREGG